MRGAADRPGMLVRFLRFLLYYIIAIPVLYLLVLFEYGLKMRGKRNLRGVHGAVVVCNHVHPLDCAMIACAFYPRRVVFATLKRNFQIPVAGFLIRQLCSLSVGESLSEVRSFAEEASALLDRDRWLCVYPEGVLHRYTPQLMQFHSGAFHLAHRAKKPVCPLVLTKRPARGLFRLFRLGGCFTLHILPPVDSAAFPNHRQLQNHVKQLMQRHIDKVAGAN